MRCKRLSEYYFTQLLFELRLGAQQGFGSQQAELRDGESSLLSLRQGDADRLQRNRQSRNASANSDGRLIQTTRSIDRILSSWLRFLQAKPPCA